MSLNMRTALGHATHEVFNQVPPLVNYNVFAQDATLVESVQREGAAWATDHLTRLGSAAGSEEAIQWSFDANTVTPVLHTHDRTGQRLDEVTFHPAWHHLMRTSINAGAHALSWRNEHPGRHVARAAIFFRMLADGGRPLLPAFDDTRGRLSPAHTASFGSDVGATSYIVDL